MYGYFKLCTAILLTLNFVRQSIYLYNNKQTFLFVTLLLLLLLLLLFVAKSTRMKHIIGFHMPLAKLRVNVDWIARGCSKATC